VKNNRNGQAGILSDGDYSKIRKQIQARKYKLLLDIAWHTGERWGAIVQLQVPDVYREDGTLQDCITFRARTRKASPDGKRKTRQIPIHPVLQDSLQSYRPESDSIWLFPRRDQDGPISLRWADMILRAAVEKAGLDAKGVSTHSTRRSFITSLAKKGIALSTIKKITGHTDLKVLSRYIEISDEDVRNAIATL